MTVLDTDILGEIQSVMIEPEDAGVSWASGFWTAAEVIDYMNDRQRDFLKETFCLITADTALFTVPGVLRHPLPQDWICTYMALWHASDGTYKELPRSDSFEADLGQPAWIYETKPKPDLCSDGDQATLTMQVMPAASDAGLVEILYVKVSAALSNSGVAFEVPDEFVPAIKWGVISDMLSKIGRAHDPRRAAYAESRYAEGVEAAKAMLRGFI
jgi:hypothetical protein